MNLSSIVDTVELLDIDEELSNPSTNAKILGSESGLDSSHYVVSDVDQELLILIQFKQMINLQSIKLYASKDNIDIDADEMDDISLPKDVYLYKLQNLNINFDDLDYIKHDKSTKCRINKLPKGQIINLQKEAKLTAKVIKSTLKRH